MPRHIEDPNSVEFTINVRLGSLERGPVAGTRYLSARTTARPKIPISINGHPAEGMITWEEMKLSRNDEYMILSGVAYFTGDLPTLREIYTDFLGFTVTEEG